MSDKTFESAMNEIQNAVYKVAADCFGELERKGLIRGNSHHIAQNIAREAKMKVRARWNYNKQGRISNTKEANHEHS